MMDTYLSRTSTQMKTVVRTNNAKDENVINVFNEKQQ